MSPRRRICKFASLYNSRYLPYVARKAVCFLSFAARQTSSYQLFSQFLEKAIVSFAAASWELEMSCHRTKLLMSFHREQECKSMDIVVRVEVESSQCTHVKDNLV